VADKTPVNIMLVDDDEDLLGLLQMRLRAAGYDTTLAHSAEEAMSLLAVQRPGVLVSDLRMSGMDGIALFKQVRQSNPLLPVIIMTAHGSIPEAVEATRKGVFSFLTKPLNGRDLLREIERALAAAPQNLEECPADMEWRRDIIAQSGIMEDLLRRAKMLASGDSAILIQGESGTVKELLARALHRASPRADGPFVAVNCGAIPENLLESELFGHEKGAFSGALRRNLGLVRSADGGTLFLDEIGEMPPSFQVKLLRVLQEHRVRAVGASADVAVDLRVISATNRDLQTMVDAKEFRADLFYRLNVALLELPPLEERREDIPLLARYFLGELAQKAGKKINDFAPEAMELLVHDSWPGNIRQLYNVVEQAVVLCNSALLTEDILQLTLRSDLPETLSFNEARRQFEQEYLINLMKLTGGNVSQAAALAQRNRTDFYKILQRHHIVPAHFKNVK